MIQPTNEEHSPPAPSDGRVGDADPHYGSPRSLSRLWSPRWLDVFRHGRWCSGDAPPPSPIRPRFDSYHPHSCNGCKRGPFTGTPTLRCSMCRVARYCCRDHQGSDWADHRRWCRAFASSRGAEEYRRAERPGDIEEWRRESGTLANRIVGEMGVRATRHSAVHMVMMQPRCRRCLVAGVADGVELIVCPRCGDVALCRGCCDEGPPSDGGGEGEGGRHVQFHPGGGTAECDSHILSLSCTGMVVEQGSPLCAESDTDCAELFLPGDWAEYLDAKRGDFRSVPEDPMMRMAPVVAFVTDGLSIPLTILHALCRPEVMGPETAASLTRLVVHLVGASAVEELAVNKYIELLRLMPALAYLRIVTVGPDLEALAGGFPPEGRPLNFVDEDESPIRDGCDARIVRRPGYYHHVGDELEEPNLVVACHSGLHDDRFTERWLPTIEYLASRGVPCIFTGYNMDEAVADAQILEGMGVDVLVPPSPNPFRGLRPFPDPSRDPSDFIYSNAYFLMFRGVVRPKDEKASSATRPRSKDATPTSEALKAAYQTPVVP